MLPAMLCLPGLSCDVVLLNSIVGWHPNVLAQICHLPRLARQFVQPIGQSAAGFSRMGPTPLP
jgi:hypothetical protein